MAPARNISKILLAVVSTGMIVFLTGAFSGHTVRADGTSNKLKKDGTTLHVQKKTLHQRRWTLDGDVLAVRIVFFGSQIKGDFINAPESNYTPAFLFPAFRGPPAVV